MNPIEENLLRVREHLDSFDLKYEVNDNIVTYQLNIPCRLRHCQVKIIVQENDITIYAISPINAAENARASVAEFITRANYGLKNGNFEMNYSDGEVRYKTYLSSHTSPPASEKIGLYIGIAILSLYRYGDSLLKNMFGFGDPEKDIEAIEG